MVKQPDRAAVPVITLSPEYGYALPLEGPFESFDLPASLLDALGDWQQFFENNFVPNTGGWKTPEARRHWAEEAAELEFGLRRAVWERATVAVDLWPLDDSDSLDASAAPE